MKSTLEKRRKMSALMMTVHIAALNSTIDTKRSSWYSMMGLANRAVENNIVVGRDRHGMPRKRKKGGKLQRR